jgi:dipeptidase E
MRLLLISSSVVHGHGYLDHSAQEIRALLGNRRNVAFLPFAQSDVDSYTSRTRERLGAMGFDVTQVRSRADIESADAIFVGGGNTFRLLTQVIALDLVDAIRARVTREGIPYFGASAGTNLATPTIKTTNDMPIVYPPTFDALGLVPFQINPHYLDADPHTTHQGETREQRIREFHEENATPVLGLREGSMLRIEDGTVTLAGDAPARLFRRNAEPREYAPGALLPLL